MILCIDIGNTNVVMGLMSSRGVLDLCKRVVTIKPTDISQREQATDTFTAQLAFFLCEDGRLDVPVHIDGCIICSVVPEFTPCVFSAVEYVTGTTPLVVGPDLKLGLTIGYESAEQLGSDLIADAVAGVQQYEGPLAIFDLGTATTCSVIDEHATYQGTLIIPGLMISKNALVAHASQLPDIACETPSRLVGRTTVEAMQSGLFFGTAAMIDGLIEHVQAEMNSPVTTLITGGLASMIAPLCRRTVIYEENLLLKGLWDMYFLNAR